MLTSFFSNSRPFHFIVVSLLLFAGCFFNIINDLNLDLNSQKFKAIARNPRELTFFFKFQNFFSMSLLDNIFIDIEGIQVYGNHKLNSQTT